jgi:hypothetical protein
MAMAFVRSDMAQQRFDILMVHLNDLKIYNFDLFLWFESRFFCKKYLQKYGGSCIFIWSVYNNIANGASRTTNSLEGLHRS